MSEWRPRRFWKTAHVVPVAGGFGVTLDDRALRTPAKASLAIPTEALAKAVAAEWDAQETVVDPETMPATRCVNSAIDRVAAKQAEVVDHVAAYGASDLICYRATEPDGLVAREAAAWDPLTDWSATELGAPLQLAAGVMFCAQKPDSLAVLRGHVAAMTPFQLAPFHDLVALSGSLVIALAVVRGRDSVDHLWSASRVDELWQQAQWGVDAEAEADAARRAKAFGIAAELFALATPAGIPAQSMPLP